MPLLEELAPGAAHRIAQAANHLRDSDGLLREFLGSELDPLVEVIGGSVNWLMPFQATDRASEAGTRIEVLDATKARALQTPKLR